MSRPTRSRRLRPDGWLIPATQPKSATRRALEEQRDLPGAAEFAICVATFYGELAERLVNGAVEGFAVAGSTAGGHGLRPTMVFSKIGSSP